MAACKSDKPRLYTEAEITAFSTALDARLADTAKRVCKAPQVLAASTPGSSADDLAAFMTPAAGTPVAACHANVKAYYDAAKHPVQDDFDAKLPAAVALVDTCGALYATEIAKIAAHETGCSPFQVGVRPMGLFMPLVEAMEIVGAHARWNPDRAAATTALIASLRVWSDVARGRTTVLATNMRAAMAGKVMLEIERQIDTLDQQVLAHAFNALGEDLTFAEHLEAERDFFEVHLARAAIDPAWVLPGGWPAERDKLPAATWGHPRDEAALIFDVQTRLAGATETTIGACPRTLPLIACRDALRARPWPKRSTESPQAIYGRFVDGSATREQTKTALVEQVIAATSAAQWDEYITMTAQYEARLAWMRMRSDAARNGSCPKLTHVAIPGAELPVVIGPDSLTYVEPAWMKSPKTWTVKCPAW